MQILIKKKRFPLKKKKEPGSTIQNYFTANRELFKILRRGMA
jgi:hypothetical protein